MGIEEYLEMIYDLDYGKFCEAYGFKYHGTQAEKFQIQWYIYISCDLGKNTRYVNVEVLKKYGIEI